MKETTAEELVSTLKNGERIYTRGISVIDIHNRLVITGPECGDWNERAVLFSIYFQPKYWRTNSIQTSAEWTRELCDYLNISFHDLIIDYDGWRTKDDFNIEMVTKSEYISRLYNSTISGNFSKISEWSNL